MSYFQGGYSFCIYFNIKYVVIIFEKRLAWNKESHLKKVFVFGCAGSWLLCSGFLFFFSFFFSSFMTWFFFFFCSEFCHTLKWKGLGFTCLPHPDPPSHLPPHPLPQGPPRAPGPSACLMHPTWAGNLFHPWQYTCFEAVLLKHPALAFSHRV